MKPPLLAGVDYYLEEGKVVLTRAYHFKRGFCCNSHCRHCPYKPDSIPEPTDIVELQVEGLPKTLIPGLALPVLSMREGEEPLFDDPPQPAPVPKVPHLLIPTNVVVPKGKVLPRMTNIPQGAARKPKT